MTAKNVKKLVDKLSKINESVTIYRYDNGYMFEAGGRNRKGDYVTAKILCSSLEEVLGLVQEAHDIELDT